MQEALELIGAVDAGGFVKRIGDALKPCKKNDPRPAESPKANDHQAGERPFWIIEPARSGEAHRSQRPVDQSPARVQKKSPHDPARGDGEDAGQIKQCAKETYTARVDV